MPNERRPRALADDETLEERIEELQEGILDALGHLADGNVTRAAMILEATVFGDEGVNRYGVTHRDEAAMTIRPDDS